MRLIPVAILFFGIAAGLDQVNILLPRGLAGSGDSPVELSVNGSVGEHCSHHN